MGFSKYSLYPTASCTSESPKIRTNILRTLHKTDSNVEVKKKIL